MDKIPIKSTLKIFIPLIIGIFLGILGSLSYLRTIWSSYHPDFFLWWSILSTLLSIVLLYFSLGQYFEAENQKARTKAQVKIWMQDAKGILLGLDRIQKAVHTTISDVCNSISILGASADALYQSLYEERVVKEEDYQETERKMSEIVANQKIQGLKDQASGTSGNVLPPIKSDKLSKREDHSKSSISKEINKSKQPKS